MMGIAYQLISFPDFVHVEFHGTYLYCTYFFGSLSGTNPVTFLPILSIDNTSSLGSVYRLL